MADRCFWCNTDPDEAAARHEGPHATWCLKYRRSDPLVRADGRLVMDTKGAVRVVESKESFHNWASTKKGTRPPFQGLIADTPLDQVEIDDE